MCEYEKPARKHYEILFFTWAGWVFDFYNIILFTFLLIPIGEEFQLSRVTLSIALGVSLAASALGGVVFGILSDRYGRKKVLRWTIITYSIGTFLSGLSPEFFFLIIFWAVTGFGVGGEWATGQTYIGETFPPRMRGRYAALMQTGAPVGIALASLVGGFLAPVIGWRACFLLSGIPALIIILTINRLPESDLWLEGRKALDKGAVLLEDEAAFSKFLILFSDKYRPIFLKSFILTALDMTAYWFTYSWLPGYLSEERHFPISKSAIWIMMTQAGSLFGYISFGLFADRFGRRPAYSVYAVIRALGLLMITLFWDIVAAYPPVILGFMFLTGFGTGMFSGYGPLFSEIFPTTIRNTAMGSAFNLARGVQFFTPLAIAAIASKYGFGGGISLAAIFALLTGLWIWTFPETKGKRLL